MKLVEVNSKFAGSSRGKVAFRMNREIGVVALVGVEWGNTRSSARGIVVCEFRQG